MDRQACLPPICIGIVGTGYAANRRAEAIQADDRARLITAAGHSSPKTAQFCKTYAVDAAESWQHLVEDPRIDLAIVATINRDRPAIVRSALEAGKHVVVEYPLALNPTDAQDLVRLAKVRGKLLHVEHIEILGGLHQTMRRSLPDIGTVSYARYVTLAPKRPFARSWKYHREMFGFPLSAALSRIHRLTDLFGEVESVACQYRVWDERDGYFTACLCDAQLRFASGFIADVVYGKGDRFWKAERTFELHGERGTLVFEGQQGKLVRGTEVTPLEVARRRGLFAKDTACVLDYLTEGQPLYISPASGCYALQVADAARRSAELGQTVRLANALFI